MQNKFNIFLAIVIILVVIISVLGVPVKNQEIENFAKNTLQSTTFQYHSVHSIRYNIFSRKYYVDLQNENKNTHIKIKVWYSDDYETTHMIESDYKPKIEINRDVE